MMVLTVFAALPINVGAGGDDKNKWLTDGNEAGKKDKFGTLNDQDLRFITHGEQRMVLTSEGNLGIGILDPQYRLDVDGDVRISGELHIGENGDPWLEITPDGDVGIGTAEPDEALDVVGNVHVSGAFIAGSTTTYDDGVIGLSTGTDLNIDSGTLFIDNANDRVGIGTVSPNTILHISEDSSTPARLRVENTGYDLTSDAALSLITAPGGVNIEIRAQRSPSVGIIDILGGQSLGIQTSGGSVGI